MPHSLPVYDGIDRSVQGLKTDADSHSLSVIVLHMKQTHFVIMAHSQLTGCGFVCSLISVLPVIPDVMDLILKSIQYRGLESQSHNHSLSM